jgi:hypothetical protein
MIDHAADPRVKVPRQTPKMRCIGNLVLIERRRTVCGAQIVIGITNTLNGCVPLDAGAYWIASKSAAIFCLPRFDGFIFLTA